MFRNWNTKKTLTDEKRDNLIDPTNDSLAQLQRDLSSLEKNLKQNLDYWQKKKVETLVEYKEIEVTNIVETSLFAALTKILAEIKSLIQSADQNLKTLLEQKQPHIIELCKQITEDCLALKNHQDNSQKIRLDICNKSIESFSESLTLINAIQVEIEYCLQVNHAGAQFLIWLANTLLSTLTHNMAPTIEVNTVSLERKILNNEVQAGVNEIKSSIIDSVEATEESAQVAIETNDVKLDKKGQMQNGQVLFPPSPEAPANQPSPAQVTQNNCLLF